MGPGTLRGPRSLFISGVALMDRFTGSGESLARVAPADVRAGTACSRTWRESRVMVGEVPLVRMTDPRTLLRAVSGLGVGWIKRSVEAVSSVSSPTPRVGGELNI